MFLSLDDYKVYERKLEFHKFTSAKIKICFTILRWVSPYVAGNKSWVHIFALWKARHVYNCYLWIGNRYFVGCKEVQGCERVCQRSSRHTTPLFNFWENNKQSCKWDQHNKSSGNKMRWNCCWKSADILHGKCLRKKWFSGVYEKRYAWCNCHISPNNKNIFQVSMTIIKGAKRNSLRGGDQKAFYIMNMTIYIYERCSRKKIWRERY